MARIRLRNCYIRLYDGFAAAATLNEAPANGATDFDITLASNIIIPVGARFIVVGAAQVYTVTQATGSPKTTNVTFTPALATAAGIPTNGAAIAVIGRTLQVNVNTGVMTWVINKAYDYEFTRGRLSGCALGNDTPVSMNFDVEYDFITAVTGSGVPTVEDVLKNRGEAVSWVTAGADPCEKFAVNVELDHVPECTSVEHEIVRFPEFRYESLNHDVNAARLAVAGKCKVTTITPIRRAF